MSAPSVVTLDDAQADAARATTAADAVRARLTQGEDVSAAELAEVEAAEQYAARRLDAARQRDVEQRARDDAEQLERERAAVATEWADLRRGEPAELVELRAEAARAGAHYLRAEAQHLKHREQVRARAKELGLEAGRTPQYLRSPIPSLGQAILDEAGRAIPWYWTRPEHSRETIWGR